MRRTSYRQPQQSQTQSRTRPASAWIAYAFAQDALNRPEPPIDTSVGYWILAAGHVAVCCAFIYLAVSAAAIEWTLWRLRRKKRENAEEWAQLAMIRGAEAGTGDLVEFERFVDEQLRQMKAVAMLRARQRIER